MPNVNLTRLVGRAVEGGSGEAGRVRAEGLKGGGELLQVGSRLPPSLLSLTFLACSLPIALSAAAAPFLRRMWRRERRSLRPVETSVSQ